MGFDLSTAKPVRLPQEASRFSPETSQRQPSFDLSSSVPVNQGIPPSSTMLDRALAILNGAGSSVLSAGPLEAAAHVASSSIAGLGGGLNYLGTLAASGGDTDAAKAVQQDTQNALTYQPRTKAGKALAAAADKALSAIPQGLNKAGEATADATGSPLLGTSVNVGGNALLQLLGVRGLRGAGGVAGAAEDAAAAAPRTAPNTPAEMLQQSLDNGKAVGYQATPNFDPTSTALQKLGQGIAGQKNVEQRASVANQGVTNALAARAVGLNPKSLITTGPEGNLTAIRNAAVDQGYAPIADLPGTIPVDGQFVKNIAAIKSAHANELSGNPDVVQTADILMNPNKTKSAPSVSASTRTVPDNGDVLMPQTDHLLGSLANPITRPSTKTITTGPMGQSGTIDPLTLISKAPSFDPATMLDYISTLRSRASDAYAAGRADAGVAFRKQAGELEALLDRHLQDSDDLPPDMLNNYRAARQLIAKTHTVGDALNKSTGNVNASTIADMYQNKDVPLTGDLKTIADFANAAPGITKVPQGAPLPTTPLNTVAGAATAHATGGASLALIPAARLLAAKWLLQRNETPNLLQPLDKTFGQSALDAVHGNATAFSKIYGNSAPGGLLSSSQDNQD